MIHPFDARGVRWGVAALALLVAGCQAKPETATLISQPKTPVVKNITSFSNSLRCMDSLFLAYGKRDIVITSDGLPDQTKVINAGTKDMMITTLSKMSERSSAFRFVDIEQGGSVELIQNRHGAGFSLPTFYIRGAITQIDRNIATDSAHGGVAIQMASLGLSQDQMLSVVTIDMNIGDLVKRQIIPGLHTTNTITVVSRGEGVDAEGIIQKASVFLQVNHDRTEGTHQSVRTLIELGLIEALGKLTKVPYWRCLQLDSSDPQVMQQARGWYDDLSESDRIRAVQTAMTSLGLYQGPADGSVNPDLQQAVNRYKAGNDLIANGRIDFDLYYKLLIDNHALVPAGNTKGGPQLAALHPGAPVVPAQSSGQDPIGLRVLRDSEGEVHPGTQLSFAVAVRRDADLYCYYEYFENGKPWVVRVFPNRFQPEKRLRASASLALPGPEASFLIQPSVAGVTEQLACVAVGTPYPSSKAPALLGEGDLVPLKSVNRLYQVVDQHLSADRFNSSAQTVLWEVR